MVYNELDGNLNSIIGILSVETGLTLSKEWYVKTCKKCGKNVLFDIDIAGFELCKECSLKQFTYDLKGIDDNMFPDDNDDDN